MAPKTQECILDAAESLFVEHGFAATSLRSIAAEAGVNLAATHYHFGSKEGLFQAVVHRRVTPINQARLAGLDALIAVGNYSLEDVLHTFLDPLANAGSSMLPRLTGRIFSEPPSVSRPMLEKEFGAVANRYVAVIKELLPELGDEEIHWRIQFLVGSMLQTLSVDRPIGYAGDMSTTHKFEHLVQYTAAAFRAPATSI